MSDYLHGAYGQIQSVGARVAGASQSAIVYVGTAPVHTIEGGAKNVNVPIAVSNIAEAKKFFGYSDDWAKYTLCEAMHVHLEQKAVGPLVFINVLNPATHVSSTAGSASLTPANGRVTIPNAESIILDTVVVKTSGQTPTTYVKGTDYTIAYDMDKKIITIQEITEGGLGSSALAITWDIIDATAVTANDVIGSTDGLGQNTGLYAVKNVYQITGYVPAYLAAPGFSSVVEVHNAMYANSKKINGHWDAYMFVDLPLLNGVTPLTMDTVATYKTGNGFNKENETVYFPLATGTDGKTYHLSVLAAANFQELLLDQDGIPYKTASNTECGIIENLYMGAANAGRIYDDELINKKLNKNGIASAVYTGGRWVIWGAHSADYDQNNADQINVAETNRMMLFYLSNDFQRRRPPDVDKPMSANNLRSIAAEEQARVDALIKIGALIYGEVRVNASAEAQSDIMQGDYSFVFDVTTTPLAKSLTAIVNWTDQGFVTYFENIG